MLEACQKWAKGQGCAEFASDCELLTIGDMEVSQIAVECGFDSIPHFNRTFKQLTGLTPTQYRNQIMK